jgi:hypothetical protein
MRGDPSADEEIEVSFMGGSLPVDALSAGEVGMAATSNSMHLQRPVASAPTMRTIPRPAHMATRDTDNPEEEFYRRYAMKLIRDAKAQQEQPFAYQDLAEKLPDYGVRTTHRVLINRLNREGFSFVFGLQLLAALGVKEIKIPQPPKGLKRTKRSS